MKLGPLGSVFGHVIDAVSCLLRCTHLISLNMRKTHTLTRAVDAPLLGLKNVACVTATEKFVMVLAQSLHRVGNRGRVGLMHAPTRLGAPSMSLPRLVGVALFMMNFFAA